MKHLLLKKIFSCRLAVALLMLSAVAECFSQDFSFSHPDFVYSSFAKGVQVVDVKLTEGNTSMRLKIPKMENGVFALNPSCWLEDAKGTRYSIRKIDDREVREGDTACVALRGSVTLTFDPLPATTRVLDFISENQLMGPRIYGIHDHTMPPDVSSADERVDDAVLQEMLSKKGNAVVKGKVVGFKAEDKRVWCLVGTDVVDYTRHEFYEPVLIKENGEFDISLPLNHPCLAILQPGLYEPTCPILLYLQPGDTSVVEVEGLRSMEMSVKYQGCEAFTRLLTHFPIELYSTELQIDEKKSFEENHDSLQNRYQEIIRLCDYLIHQHGLNPMEARILLNEARMQHTILQLKLADKIHRQRTESNTGTAMNGNFGDAVPSSEGWREYECVLRDADLPDETYVLGRLGGIVAGRLVQGPVKTAIKEIAAEPTGQGEKYVTRCWQRLDSTLRTHERVDSPRPAIVENALLTAFMQLLGTKSDASTNFSSADLQAGLKDCINSPFLKARLPEALVPATGIGQMSHDVSGRCGYDVLERITDSCRGKYVEIVHFSKAYPLSQVDNLVADFAEHKDVALVFVTRESEMTEYEFDGYKETYLAPVKDCCFRLSEQDYAKLCVSAGCVSGDFSYITLDREGRVLDLPLSILPENQFRRSMRFFVKTEQIRDGE